MGPTVTDKMLRKERTREHRIALLVPSMRGGGAERAMLGLATGFSERGIPVDLVLVKAEGEYLSQLPERVRLVNLDSNRTAGSILKLVRYLRLEQPASLLSTLAQTNVVALLAKLMLGKHLHVVTRMENTFSEMFDDGSFKQRQTLRLLKMLLPTADGIAAISQGVADDLCKLIPVACHKVMTIYSPVVWPNHSNKAAAPVEHPWFDNGSVPVVLAAGRLTSVKDHATLLRAFARVLCSRPARLLILGVGPERENLLKLADHLGLSQCVDLPGFDPNPFVYMSRSRVFVLPSKYEGFGNVLPEAMACGTPVVSTDCRSGPREILEDGRWGRLVPVGDWHAMAEAILDTLDNPIPSDQLISRASDFSSDASIDRYLEVLTGSSN